MESERKIEKLLRAYAKKRRAQAGDPLALTPATRRLLQAEVARRAAQPEDETASVTLWELFRQRWAVLVGFAVIMFFGAALFLPALSKSKSKAQKVTAMSNLRQIGLAVQMAANDNSGNLPASLDALTNQLVPARALTDPETGKPFVYPAAGENLGQLSSNSVLAYSPANHQDRAVLFADGRVELVNGQRLYQLTNPGGSQLVAADEPASLRLAEAPAIYKKPDAVVLADNGLASKAAAAVPTALSQPAGFTHFASNVAQNSFKNTVVPDRATPVLASFEVQQNGSAIRVVDADGSVYDGSMQPENDTLQNNSAPQTMPPPPTAGLAQNQPPNNTPTGDTLSTAQKYFFRVTGINQTLKQKVEFAGNLLALASAATNAPPSSSKNAGLAGGRSGERSQALPIDQLPWSNSRIAGTAIVADTNKIEINALPQ